MGPAIVIFTRPECELCDRVAELLRARGIEPTFRDISDDVELLEAYGDRIPVLRDEQERELAYPFDGEALVMWLEAAT